MAGFPTVRLRRLRGSETMRRLVQETRLSASEFVYPLFVTEDPGGRQEIEPMPGCFQLPLSDLPAEAQERERSFLAQSLQQMGDFVPVEIVIQIEEWWRLDCGQRYWS